MATSKKTSIAIAASAAMTAGLALSPSIASAENPFAAQELSNGYMQLAEHHAEEGKCGEAKCGGDKKTEEGKCGEAKCGGDKKAEEGKCGGDKKMDEGKCGEAKCGGNK
ncbi:low-complexity protein [Methylophaga sp. OBS1]|uniref:HvfA family oxazolone/thioamide-modified RiPP metallophore n=1 Tax=Methylophaga sp. OBS1 TaxID=2991933 RepID=UPI0022555012|nr:low-complexity protein [Methylophaga sp. OBS1]MCX4191525.1 low-complexity protein [Methylophaga sp. OBS1]MCX4191530.1 low-complexity protein [Methylophaga sp. OBS1]